MSAKLRVIHTERDVDVESLAYAPAPDRGRRHVALTLGCALLFSAVELALALAFARTVERSELP